jgi:NAD(P)H dehydrogenase (quinone)
MKNSSTKSPRLLAILAHPKSDSFCKSLFQKGLDTFKFLGFELDVIDLYQGDFPPVMPLEELQRGGSFETAIQDYAHKLQAADGLFIVHPDWWGGPPAILKGWLDRVLRPGVAYDYEGEEFEDKEKVGLLGGKKAYVVVTTDQAAPKAVKLTFSNSSGLTISWASAVSPRARLKSSTTYSAASTGTAKISSRPWRRKSQPFWLEPLLLARRLHHIQTHRNLPTPEVEPEVVDGRVFPFVGQVDVPDDKLEGFQGNGADQFDALYGINVL